ncbi:MAG TPA: phenylalanine--tRNA ligase subunit beta, partial [Actinomycetota bacterium]|nr:phenylalanine--tRNA ligase subunit beta [Actinomycetota bacterium]
MRAPMSWLREYVDLPAELTGRELATALIGIGLEVETVDTVGEDATGPLVVGQVRQIEELTEFRKPIRYCAVDVGPDSGGVRGIVCGATNFAVGDLVVVALPGSVLPGGFAISARETYGH